MRLDLLMPARGDDYAAMAAEEAEHYVAAFAARGITLGPLPWNEAPGIGDAALALFAWGYHLAPERWREVLDRWPAERPLLNPPALIAWNVRKTYLAELERKGVLIVPSWFGAATPASVAAAFARFGCEELVVKPQISAGSHQTRRLKPGDPVPPLAEAILQPFLPAVGKEGELSLLFIGGTFSHAVRKVAKPGDFRIQPQFGGQLSRFDPPAEALSVATQALAALPEAPVYARVDLIRLPAGSLALMELEVIEPDLYPDLGDDVPGKLADAVIAYIGQAQRISGTPATTTSSDSGAPSRA